MTQVLKAIAAYAMIIFTFGWLMTIESLSHSSAILATLLLIGGWLGVAITICDEEDPKSFIRKYFFFKYFS